MSMEGGGNKGGGWVGALGAITGGISGLAGLKFPSFGGLPASAGVTFGPNSFAHTGGAVRFQTGGEVPAVLHQGEFVVRRSVAQDNKEALKEMNAGGKKIRGTQNVFMIKANDASSFADMLSTPSARAQLEIQVIRAIMANGQIRQIIKDFAK